MNARLGRRIVFGGAPASAKAWMGGHHMGYFEVITKSYFKTMPDGQRFFFPFGIVGKGYAIPSDDHYRRIERQCRYFLILAFVLCFAFAMTANFSHGIVGLVVYTVCYLVWLRFALRDLRSSEERLSFTEIASAQARAYNVWLLGLLMVCAFAFVAVGILILIALPQEWLIAVAAIAFFGCCGCVLLRMLIIRVQMPYD